VRARAFADPADRRWVRDQVTNAVAAGCGIAACILAVVLVVRPGGPMLTAQLSLFTLLGAVLGFCGIMLALRVMVQLFHRRECPPGRARCPGLSRGSRAAPASGWGGAACSSSSTRSGGSARGSRRTPCRSR